MNILNHEKLRQLSTLMISFLLAGLVACEQIKNVTVNEESQASLLAIDSSQTDIYASLKDSLNTDWIRENPELTNTKTSFFDKVKAENYFVAPIQISGQSIPFAWDNNLSILNFLLSKNANIEILKGAQADPNYKGIKIVWKQTLSGLLWVDDKIFESPINNWHLIKETDCPDTIIFPTLSFGKQFEVADAITNNLEGLAVIPFNNEINKIKSSDVSWKTKSGMIVNGKAFDFDADGIYDVFLYNEELEETTYYSRLYLNVEGKWECKYVKFDEVCI